MMPVEVARTVEQTGYNTHQWRSDSIIQMRLDTTKLLDDLEAYYRGSRVTGYKHNQDGGIEPVFQRVGRQLMNEEGIQALMSWLSILFNPHTVQGNKKSDDYVDFLVRVEKDLARDVMVNLHEYGIEERDYGGIVNRTMDALDMFFSRTVDNKERESYADTLRSVERVGEMEKKGGLAGLFGLAKN